MEVAHTTLIKRLGFGNVTDLLVTFNFSPFLLFSSICPGRAKVKALGAIPCVAGSKSTATQSSNSLFHELRVYLIWEIDYVKYINCKKNNNKDA